MSNLQKIFVMPIFAELSNLHLLAQWKSLKPQVGLSFDKLRTKLTGVAAGEHQFSLVEPSDYMKRIGDHLKAYLAKLKVHFEDLEEAQEDSEDESEGAEQTSSGKDLMPQLDHWVSSMTTYLI